ncbi:MAG: metallophosphoesterase, partial [Pirellulales bacterium]|nr:metallophosphoesterase [Pirellulales bacterium]
MAVGWRRLGALGLAILAALGARAAWAIEAEPISDGSFTIILLPDTQNYSTSYPEIYNIQTQWIADHKDSHNIQFVLHQGDVTNNNNATEFARARTAMSTLDAAGVPYSMAAGNHDYGPSGNGSTRDSLFNDPTYFGPGSPYASQTHIGGFFETGKTDNSYSTFTAGGKDWLVFSTEFGPRDEVVAWMNTVAAAHPDHNFILNTHAYIYSDGTRYDWATKGTNQTWNPHNYTLAGLPGGVNDGEELWNKLVKNYENWKFTFNGHVLHDGTGWLASEGTNGNVVHQILANYQMLTPEGGNGYLRIMEFLADGDTVKVSSYSPHLGAYLETADQEFTLSMTSFPPDPEPIRGVSCASVQVVDSTNAWTIAGTGPAAFSVISPANPADVSFALDTATLYRPQGVLMASVSQNSRGGNYGTVEVSQKNFFSGFDENILQIATSWASAGGEHNVNVATAFFPFDDPWRAAHVENNGTLREHANVDAGNVTKTATGRYRLTLPDTNSQTDGMLFVIGGENEDNIVSTAPTADGTAWDLVVRDNTSTAFGTFQDKRWSFVFVDYDAPGLVGGRVAANGSLLHAEGGFSLTHTAGSGAYRLHITDYT